MPAEDRLSARLNDLEQLFTHLERQVADLNQVILRQQQKIELLQKRLRALEQPDSSSFHAPRDEPYDLLDDEQ